MMDGGEITAPDTPPISSSPTTPISTISSSSFLSQTFRFSHNEGDAIDDDFLEKERIRISKMLGDATSNYKYCINLLCRAISEIEALQKEKMDLTEEFLSAKRKLDVFIEGPIGKENMAPSSSSSSMSPVVVGGKRSVPKSISIRSKGFLSIKNTNIADGERNSNGNSLGIEVKHPHRLLVPVTGKVVYTVTTNSVIRYKFRRKKLFLRSDFSLSLFVGRNRRNAEEWSGAGSLRSRNGENRALQQVGGNGMVSIWETMSVCTWNGGASTGNTPPKVQDTALSHGHLAGRVPLRPSLSLPPPRLRPGLKAM